MSSPYHKENVTVVFKTSNRSNAKTKMKTFRNKSIDDILDKISVKGIKSINDVDKILLESVR